MARMNRMQAEPNVSIPDHRSGEELKDDHIVVENSSSEPEEVGLDTVDDAARAVVKGTAVTPGQKGPRVNRYTVIRGGPILSNGNRTMLKEGKVIDSLNYDIRKLQQQGIRLQRYVEEDLPLVD